MGNQCCHDRDVVPGLYHNGPVHSLSNPFFQQQRIEQAEREKDLIKKAEREKALRENAEREKALMEKALREKALMKKAEREKAQREKAERDQAQRRQAQRETQRHLHQLRIAHARIQQLQDIDARRQQMEPEQSSQSEGSDEGNQVHVSVTRVFALSIQDDQIQFGQFISIQIATRDNSDCASEPQSSRLAIEPPPSIRELLTFNVVLAPGTSISMTMDFDETLNDLAEKLQESRGYRLRDITVEGNKFTVNQHGEYSLTDLGVVKQSKVVCNSR